MSKDHVNVVFRIAPDMRDALNKYCEENEHTMSQVARIALREFLERRASS